MEKLFINTLYIITVICFIFLTSSNVYATKSARTSINDLLTTADIVAVVDIESTQLTDNFQQQVHTSTPLPIINHVAKIVKKIKATTSGSNISFLNTKGLRAGKKYLVFLKKDKENNLQVLANSFGAIRIAYISMKLGVEEAARISESHIVLPAVIKTETGIRAKNEQASFVWAELSQLVGYLRKNIK